MSSYLARWTRRRWTRRVLGTASAVLAVLTLAGSPASAATADARVSVAALTPTTASLVATGFTPSSTVRFQLMVGNCVGESTAVGHAVELDVVRARPPDRRHRLPP